MNQPPDTLETTHTATDAATDASGDGDSPTGARAESTLRAAEAAQDGSAEATAEAAGSGAPARRKLRNISEIRAFFRTNETPVFFIGATSFNLLGIDRWVRNFSYIPFYDSWGGYHPRVFSPPLIAHADFESGEDINNYLLEHPSVQQHIARQMERHAPGERPKVVMVFFDERTEAICERLGYDLILPSFELRNHLDSKITTTRLGNEAGAPSVPNVLTTVEDYDDLLAQAQAAGLGDDLVLQSAYGDSGKTTFFVASRDDWNKCSTDIVGEQVKVMKRIRNRATAVEAVNTRHGTIVGPFMTDLTGYPELTPYRGGWCGNDVYPQALRPDQRARAIEHVSRLGDRLREEGYRGFFEVDVLVDLDSDEVYLGELNPRISGVSSLTTVTAGAYADMPLFLFHLLEYLDVDYDIEVEEINERWRELAATDVFSQLIMKTSKSELRLITEAPETGIYRLGDDGTLTFERKTLDWTYLNEPEEAFFLRVYGPGEYLFKGADLGILVTRSRMQTEEGELTDAARAFIQGIHNRYRATPVETSPAPMNYLAYLK
ncbi:biotin carboxylase [Kineosphaera limosa]|nr:biotin carboxylase [Kineosphaera limosa]NYD99095.1 biotin carboxylase [Kineosphaera limosa]